MNITRFSLATYCAETNRIGPYYPQVESCRIGLESSKSRIDIPIRKNVVLTDFLSCEDLWGMSDVLVSARAFDAIVALTHCDITSREVVLLHQGIEHKYFYIKFQSEYKNISLQKYIDFSKSKFNITNLLRVKDRPVYAKSIDDVHTAMQELRASRDYAHTIFAETIYYGNGLKCLDIFITDFYDFNLYVSSDFYSKYEELCLTGLELLPTNRIVFDSCATAPVSLPR